MFFVFVFVSFMKLNYSLLAVMLLLSACARTKAGVPGGAFYTGWKDRSEISHVDNSVKPIKKGCACVTNMLYVAAWGDASIEKAMKNGGISKVSHVDDKLRTVGIWIPLYFKGCTVVTGE